MPRLRRPGPDWDPNGPRRRHCTDRPARLDLSEPDRAAQVLRIAGSHPEWRACLTSGWDRDDLRQEVLFRVLERQARDARGTPLYRSVYDPTRASIGKYLFVLTLGVLRNLRTLERALGAPAEQLLAEGDIESLEGEVDGDDATRPDEAASLDWAPEEPWPVQAAPRRRHAARAGAFGGG